MVHELLHAVVHPDFGASPATVIGCWPAKLLFYAHYEGPFTRNRFLLVFATPFAVISLLPMVLAVLHILPHGCFALIAGLSTLNALIACGDYFGFALRLWQVPRRAFARNKGWRTYYKISPMEAR